MKPLDFVRTHEGAIGLVVETNDGGKMASVAFVYIPEEVSILKNAWWDKSELRVVNNLPYLLANNLYHPFGRGREDVEKFYPKEKKKENKKS